MSHIRYQGLCELFQGKKPSCLHRSLSAAARGVTWGCLAYLAEDAAFLMPGLLIVNENCCKKLLEQSAGAV